MRVAAFRQLKGRPQEPSTLIPAAGGGGFSPSSIDSRHALTGERLPEHTVLPGIGEPPDVLNVAACEAARRLLAVAVGVLVPVHSGLSPVPSRSGEPRQELQRALHLHRDHVQTDQTAVVCLKGCRLVNQLNISVMASW